MAIAVVYSTIRKGCLHTAANISESNAKPPPHGVQMHWPHLHSPARSSLLAVVAFVMGTVGGRGTRFRQHCSHELQTLFCGGGPGDERHVNHRPTATCGPQTVQMVGCMVQMMDR